MYRIAFPLAILLALCNICQTQPSAPQQAIPVAEVSGAVNIGNDRVMLIADEGYNVQVVSNAGATFKTGDAQSFGKNMKPAIAGVTVQDNKKTVNDMEDVAWDSKRQAAFIITSHSLNKDLEEKPARYKLARLMLKNGTPEFDNKEIDVLKEAFKKFPFVAEAMKKSTKNGGENGAFNIEGLAFDPRTGSLLIGLRSPSQMSDGKPSAIVFTLKNPHELFDKSAPPDFDPQLKFLDLCGLGIRGMTYDDERKGFWIVAGRSDDPPRESNPRLVLSSVWFWDPNSADRPLEKAQTDFVGLGGLEGICLLKQDNQPGLLLISDDGDEASNGISRYLWLPLSKLLAPKK